MVSPRVRNVPRNEEGEPLRRGCGARAVGEGAGEDAV